MTTDPIDSHLTPLDEIISLAEAAELCGLSAGYLRLLVRNGELWGKKVGRNWVTTMAAVNNYLSKERKRGPKPKSAEESET